MHTLQFLKEKMMMYICQVVLQHQTGGIENRRQFGSFCVFYIRFLKQIVRGYSNCNNLLIWSSKFIDEHNTDNLNSILTWKRVISWQEGSPNIP